MIINSLLDIDLYKLTMCQFVFHMGKKDDRFNQNVLYKLTHRNTSQFKLPNYVNVARLHYEVEHLFNLKFGDDEIEYLGNLTVKSFGNPDPVKIFNEDFLNHLKTIGRNECNTIFGINVLSDGELSFTFSNIWNISILYETALMAILSELYIDDYLARTNPRFRQSIWSRGDSLLDEKIALILANRSFRFSDFGSRRRAGFKWHDHVIERLVSIGNLYHIGGTSNVYLAKKYDIPAIGTFAHELPMVMAGMYDLDNTKEITDVYSWLMKEWVREYGRSLSICLPDTFGSKWLFDNHGSEVVNMFEGVRHDSGDPYAFGEAYIKLCKDNGIDPMRRVIVFSDGLNFPEALRILEYFKNRVWVTFGIGTNLTNDIGINPLNIVIKALKYFTPFESTDLVKLSDNPKKNTGQDEKLIQYYKDKFNYPKDLA